MAEVIRGGLQALPKGTIRGSKVTRDGLLENAFLIILPQALKISNTRNSKHFFSSG